MAKQVHIHIHRNKTRDAGEGEGKGKWITLSPSGTHVKVDGSGEITAGPKGMAGKKPSELSKSKASGSTKKEAPAIATRQSNRGASALAQMQAQSNAHLKATGFGHLVKPAKNSPGTGTPSSKADPVKRPAVNASSLKEGQALYDKSGQKVDEVESIQRRTLGKGLTINTRAGYQVHIDESGSNSQGWSNEKPGASGSSQSAPRMVNAGTEKWPMMVKGDANGKSIPGFSPPSKPEGEHSYKGDMLISVGGESFSFSRQKTDFTTGKPVYEYNGPEGDGRRIWVHPDGSIDYDDSKKPGASGAAPTSQNQKIAAEMSKAPKPPSHPAAGGGALAADWSSSNGNWESAKKSGSSLVEKTLSSAKTQGDKTDAMLALKTRAAEEHKKGSYLGAVVVGLVNDYFDRLR